MTHCVLTNPLNHKNEIKCMIVKSPKVEEVKVVPTLGVSEM